MNPPPLNRDYSRGPNRDYSRGPNNEPLKRKGVYHIRRGLHEGLGFRVGTRLVGLQRSIHCPATTSPRFDPFIRP